MFSEPTTLCRLFGRFVSYGNLPPYRIGLAVSVAALSHPLIECVTHSHTFQQVGKVRAGSAGLGRLRPKEKSPAL